VLTLSHLRYTQQKLRPQHIGSLGDVFALRWLETKHSATHEHALNQVAFGESSALGIHGFHIDEPKRTLILFVCNPSKHVSEFADSLFRLSETGFETLFAGPATVPIDPFAALVGPDATARPTSRFVRQFQATQEESKAQIASVNVRLVFFGEPVAASSAAIIENFREDIVQLRPLIEKRFGRQDIEVTCTVKSADGSTSIPDKLKGYRQTIGMANHVRTEGPDGQVLHIGTVSLKELLQMYRALHIRFLARNVRAALNASTGSNQALAKAFLDVARGDSPPELFLFRHNGVTLTATACTASDDHLELVEPQILNGAQTVTTFARVCGDLRARSELSKAAEARLAKLFVVGRVITNGSREFVTSVTISSNRQNPIMPWHLRAHDDVQSRLQAWFIDHLGLYYEVQEGAFEGMDDDELEAQGVLDSDKCLGIKKLAQTFLAGDGAIDKMQQLKAVFEDDALYNKTFSIGRLNATPEDVVICFKIDRRIAKMLRLLGGSDKYAFVKGARSLIWALLCQAYLNDARKETYGRLHGRDLFASQEFSELLERYATLRVKPLLVWIANDSPYVDDVKAEMYGFLGSRRVFESVMDVARERWGWQHRRLGSCA
jgi:hypothetical protein